jgi:hypothetical protein
LKIVVIFILSLLFWSFNLKQGDELTLKLDVEVLNDTLHFKYSFKNNSSRTIYLNKYYFTNLTFFRLNIFDSDGKMVADSCSRMSENFDEITSNKNNYIKLKPSASYETYLVTYGCGRENKNFNFFLKEGKLYKINLIYEFDKGRIRRRLYKKPSSIYTKAWNGKVNSDTLSFTPIKNLVTG